ncbi:hypothetical protein AHMF7605_12315 [Adhaeribacter arboris]|uniref:Uncharacterized protein n=1 Tax=Adhaeribacter arboris TaxID=2072846 RepID=A0A2T2YFI2_9BACT|nr:hypothetical protein [Adhaeribacter arboris]PSR54252.1 hypothetical protein AHMF7605_12315 [Adhaeribacter arboris]
MVKNYVTFQCSKYPEIIEKNGYIEQEELLGQNIANEIATRGLVVSLESFIDWGFVFRSKFNGFEFDLIIKAVDILEKRFALSITSTLNKIEKILGKNDESEYKGLIQIIDDILRLSPHIKSIEWLNAEEWKERFSEKFNKIR